MSERTCSICDAGIATDQRATLCPRCGTAYHEACWLGPASCVREECHAAVLAAPVQPPARSFDGAKEDDDELRRREVRPPPSLSRTALPARVKSGEFTAEAIAMETASGRVLLPWEAVEFVALGIIEENVGDAPASRSGMRAMIRKLFFGESNNEQNQKPKVRHTWLLDVFAANQPAPYRFDGGVVNYRSFLGDPVSYISAQNFFRLAARILDGSRQCRLDGSMVAYLAGQRDRIHRYGSVYDFELESAQNRERLSTQVPRSEVRIPETPVPVDGEEES